MSTELNHTQRTYRLLGFLAVRTEGPAYRLQHLGLRA